MSIVVEFKQNSDTAIIILHEIYGVNDHIRDTCSKYVVMGYDVYCPDLYDGSVSFSYDQQTLAYSSFFKRIGFSAAADILKLTDTIQNRYKYLFLIGFSVGATIAWICANNRIYDGAICYYGSRIRDYQDIEPKCPILAIFSQDEKSFVPTLINKNNSLIHTETVDACHGFCDKYSESYDSHAAMQIEKRTEAFLNSIMKRHDITTR